MNEAARKPAGATVAKPTSEAMRIRFVESAPAGASIRHAFQQPRVCFATEEPISLADLPAARSWPEPAEELVVVFLAPGGGASAQLDAEWLSPPDHPEAPPAVACTVDGARVQWRPGRAIVECLPARRANVLAGLIDFAFHEGDLRGLERTLESHELQAAADVPLAYRIRRGDRSQWQRLGETIEALYRMRLTFARLEPRLAYPPRCLPRPARRIVARLQRGVALEARLETFSDRLEACEDLYEGATDRIADFRWYRGGHMLEWGILCFLFIEVLLLVGDLYLHYIDYLRGFDPE